jgi:hypothetical protein
MLIEMCKIPSIVIKCHAFWPKLRVKEMELKLLLLICRKLLRHFRVLQLVCFFFIVYKIYLLILDPTKYFGCELGAQTYFDFKNDRYIVNGEHDAIKLQELLDGFIKKFVLCPACDNPETILVLF